MEDHFKMVIIIITIIIMAIINGYKNVGLESMGKEIMIYTWSVDCVTLCLWHVSDLSQINSGVYILFTLYVYVLFYMWLIFVGWGGGALVLILVNLVCMYIVYFACVLVSCKASCIFSKLNIVRLDNFSLYLRSLFWVWITI